MKKLLAIILSILVLVSLCACQSAPQNATENNAPANPEEESASMMTFTVTVVHKDGSSKDFTFETAQRFVGPVLEAEGLIEGNAGPYGMEITKVDGVQAIYSVDKAYWAVFEGEEYALQGIDTTPVVDGGVYKLVYTNA